MPLETRFTRAGSKLLYRGQAVRLAGIYPPKANQQAGIEALDVDPGPIFDQLRTRRNNYFRFPMLAYYHYDEPGAAYSPYLRETNGKWKLDSFNANYFNRLRSMIEKAAARGIAVPITMFDCTGLEYETSDREERWPHNPWNAANNNYNLIHDEKQPVGGIPEFYHVQYNAKQKDLQARFIQHVVALTKDYWNVFYEIMNEPGGGPTYQHDRITWANWVTGEIDKETLGARLIFYNDFTGSLTSANGRGADVNYWRANRATFTNYDRLDGVIFHGDPAITDPNDTRYDFRTQEVFLASTDAWPSQDDSAANNTAATRALNLGMPYQAETLKFAVADVLKNLNPTDLLA